MSMQSENLTIILLLLAVMIGIGFWAFSEEENDIEIADPNVVKDMVSNPNVPSRTTDEGLAPPESGKTSAATSDLTSLPPALDLSQANRDLDLFGRVLDGEGNPVPGAKVQTFRELWGRTNGLAVTANPEFTLGPWTQSALDGTFSLRLAKGDMVNLRASKVGYGNAEIPGCQAGQKIDVFMQKEATLKVICVDTNDSPIPDVVLMHRRNSPADTTHRLQGKTDKDGSFTFFGLVKGVSTISCIQTSHGSPEWKEIEIEESENAELKIVFPEGRRLLGKVTAAETGAPIIGAKVGIGWTMRSFVLTDDQGVYELPAFSGNGSNDVHVTADGFGRMGKKVPDAGDLDFALKRSDTVVGRLMGVDGKPVAGAPIEAIASKRRNRRQEIDNCATRSDEEGHFSIPNLRRDLPHTLVITAQGHGRFLLDFDPHPERPGVVDLGDLTLPPAQILGGQVTDAQGQPIVGAKIRLTGHNPDRGRLRVGQPFAASFYGQTETRRTDDLGRYRFGDLSHGEYSIGLDLGIHREHPKFVTLAKNESKEDVNFHVKEDGVIHFRCIDSDEQPVKGVAISIITKQHRGRVSNVRSGSDGKAIMKYLENRTYSVLTWSPSGLLCPDPFDVQPQGQEITIAVKKAVKISGHILIPNEPKPGRYLVDAKWEGARTKTVITKENGSFSIEVPQGAIVELSVDGKKQSEEGGSFDYPKGDVYTGHFDKVVAPAENISLSLTPISDNAEITVAVVDSQGNPVADSQVSADPWYGKAPTDNQGRVRLSDLRALATNFTAYAPRGSTNLFRSKRVRTIPRGQTITLTLHPATTISGKVVDSKGNPAPWAYVEAASTDGGVSDLSSSNVTSTTADNKGAFTVRLGEAKRFRLHARSQTRPGSRPPRTGMSVIVTSPRTNVILTIP